jgi:hypothetical protein
MIGNMLHFLIASSLPVGLMCMMWRLNARRWSRLANAYPAFDAADCVATRTMQTVILTGGAIGWNSYKGIVTVGVTKEGILLQMMLPFSLFHLPILIPFGDCHIEPRRWYMIGKTVQYALRGVTDVQMIIHDDLQEWIESQAVRVAMAQTSTRISNDAFADMHPTG